MGAQGNMGHHSVRRRSGAEPKPTIVAVSEDDPAPIEGNSVTYAL